MGKTLRAWGYGSTGVRMVLSPMQRDEASPCHGRAMPWSEHWQSCPCSRVVQIQPAQVRAPPSFLQTYKGMLDQDTNFSNMARLDCKQMGLTLTPTGFSQ